MEHFFWIRNSTLHPKRISDCNVLNWIKLSTRAVLSLNCRHFLRDNATVDVCKGRYVFIGKGGGGRGEGGFEGEGH